MSMTFESFCSLVQTEEDCIELLFKVKWPDGFRCPVCSHSQCYVISTRRLPLYECMKCRTQTSLISDTIFRYSRTPLRLWFQAIFLHTRWRGINALQLSEEIQVTYKTAWLMCHKIRYAMSRTDGEKLLEGIVSVTDALLYRRMIPPSNYREIEQPIVAGAAEDDNGEYTHVKIRISPRSLRETRHSSPDMTEFVQQCVAPETIPHTIVTKRHGKVRNPELIYFCRHAEMWMASTFRGVWLKHLQVYLDQYCYVKTRDKESLYDEILRDCVRQRGIDYPTLTGNRDRRSTRPVRHKIDMVSRQAG